MGLTGICSLLQRNTVPRNAGPSGLLEERDVPHQSFADANLKLSK